MTGILNNRHHSALRPADERRGKSIEKVGKNEERDARVDADVSFGAAVGDMLKAPMGG
jgi:hypothetical protein